MYSQYSSARSGVLRILRSNLRTAAVGMVACLASLTAVHAAPITVNPGDTLEVNFRFTQPFLASPNLLEFIITPAMSLPSGSNWVANFTLYNGATPLLTWGGGSGPTALIGFVYASDLPSGCGSACIDFTNIRNQSISGRWDMALQASSPSLTFDPASPNAVRIDAGVSGGSLAPTLANISSITLNGVTVYPQAQVVTINSVADLQNIQNNLSGNYVLGRDIDASGFNFTPIGQNTEFTGTLDGNGYTISNLTISNASGGVGLFSTLAGTVKNLGLTSASIGGMFAGAIAGSLRGGGPYAGLIVDSYSTGVVSGTGAAGGLVGWNVGGTVIRSYSTASVTGGLAVGGLVGINSGLVTQSYSLGSATASGPNMYAGGVVGSNVGTGISWAPGTVVGAINQTYATGRVLGVADSYTGGIAGLHGTSSQAGDGNVYAPVMSNSFWDTQTTNQSSAIGYPYAGATTNSYGMTTTQLQSGSLPSSFDPTVWTATAGQYPTLISNPQTWAWGYPSLGPQDPQSRPDVPLIVSVPPIEPAPVNPSTHNLVMIVHGWNSSPDEWPTALASTIRSQIKQRHDQGLLDKNEVWTVQTLDWRSAAGSGCPLGFPCFVQWNAWANAIQQGTWLGQQLAPANFDRIHFIAHSAGSELVEMAATWIRSHSTKQPFIQTTLLDAYCPFPELCRYGASANWAEQYLDMRDNLPAVVGWGTLENTNLTLPEAFNFDVTSLDQRTVVNIVQAHQWPYLWYQQTAESPDNWHYGWGASSEHDGTRVPKQTELERSQTCQITSADTVCSAPSAVTGTLQFAPVPNVFDPGLFPSTVITTSTTGNASLSTPKWITLVPGSPVWITLRANVVDSFNALQFAYEFPVGADGLLSVFVDDSLVFRADQRIASSGLNQSGLIPVGNIAQGSHSLSFRLDHFSETKPTVEISDFTIGNARLVEATNIAPIANAGTDQTAKVGTLVQLNGTASSDPDNGPLPLVYEWTQVSGPAVSIKDSMTASPSFVPSSAGSYVISLVVHDGEAASVPATVGVTVAGTDTSPPTITPSVTGTAGSNGWYTSNVALSWSVTDPDSAIVATTGCAATTVTRDTAGSTFTCKATSAGGTGTKSVTIRRDATQPLIAVLSPLSSSYWTYKRNQAVWAIYGCFDLLSGIDQCAGTVALGARIDTASAGTKTFTVNARDKAGNERKQTVTYRVK